MLFLTSPLFLFKRSRTLLPGTRVIVWDRLESPLVNILFMTKLLSPNLLSWDMDGLLTLWQLLIPCSLGNGCCMLGFLIFIIVVRNFLYHSLYITHRKIIKAPLLHKSLGPCVCLSFSLSLSLSHSSQLIPWSAETRLAHSPAWASKTLLRRHPVPLPPSRGRLVPSWEMQVLCQGLYWFSA